MGNSNVFRIPCSLVNNGISTEILALPDSGAHGFCFINQKIVKKICDRFNVVPHILAKPITPKGYNGIPGRKITHFIVLTMKIDGYILPEIPFLILDLGNQDVILGDGWMSHFDVLPDMRNRRLFWRTPPRSKLSFARHIKIPRASLYPKRDSVDYQKDADRRSQAIDHDDKRRRDGQRSENKNTEIRILSKGESLNKRVKAEKNNVLILDSNTPVIGHDISEISAPVYNIMAQNQENQIFAVSFKEIDREISSRETMVQGPTWSNKLENQSLLEKLPQCYHDFVDVFSKEASDTLPPCRSYDHKIQLECEEKLGYGRLYNQSTEELKAVKKYLIENLDKGWIVPSQAPYSSPVLFVKKPNGGLRFCVDYRKLNEITKKDRYPLPLIDETLARLNRAKIFTKLDIRQAFHRIRMHSESEELTTFRTRYGSYKYRVLPFGLTNGPATYQRYMNDILFEFLDVFCTAYLDDIIIYSENILEHEEHVKAVLDCLRQADLQADIKKCEFGVDETKYLGFIVTTKGIKVDPEKVAVIKNWMTPTNVKAVQSFLGFCNFYRRFIRNYGVIAKPLTKLTRKGTDFNFTDECQGSFEELKNRLINAPVLNHYDPDKESRIETDASDGVVAGVFSQLGSDGEWHPIAFFSKTMAPAELNYEIHDKEMLAIIRSLSHWRAELMGTPRKLEILSDHKALEYFMTTKALNARQARWAEILSEFNFLIKYRPGNSNMAADALSRREQDVVPQDLTKSSIRNRSLLKQDQVQEYPFETCISFIESFQLVNQLLDTNRRHPSLQIARNKAEKDPNSTYKIEEGLLLHQGRLVIPDNHSLITELIKEAHNQPSVAHPGCKKTLQLLKDRYYWKGMRATVERFIENCHPCRRSHLNQDKTPGWLHCLPVPHYPWQHICVDFKSMPEDDEGFNMVAIFIDRLSKKAVTIPCKKTVTAKDLAEMYFVHCFRHLGVPESIVSDRGPQFVSEFWGSLCAFLGIKRKLSTAFHPETDGQTEIMNKYLDQRLRPFVNHFQSNWSRLLPLMDFAQLALHHESIETSPFQLLHGHPPRLSFDWKAPEKPQNARQRLAHNEAKEIVKKMHEAWNWVRTKMEKAQEKKRRDVNLHRREPDFKVGDSVWLSTKNLALDQPSRKLGHQNIGPFKIISSKGWSYELDLPPSMGSIHRVFHAKLLRKDPSNPLPGQQNPPPKEYEIIPGVKEWQVESIRTCKLVYRKLKYRANWLGADEDPEFYPASDFMYSPHLLKQFHLAHPELPGPPAALPLWLDAWERGIDNYDNLEDNSAMNRTLRAAFFSKGGGNVTTS